MSQPRATKATRVLSERKCRQCGGIFMPTWNEPLCSLDCRLWSRTKVAGECWEWTGVRLLHRDGYPTYGQIRIDKKTRLVHAISYLRYVGDIPKGHGVLHRCDNPPCWRPSHLFTGDSFVNMQDMAAKGRQVFQRDPSKHPARRKTA